MRITLIISALIGLCLMALNGSAQSSVSHALQPVQPATPTLRPTATNIGGQPDSDSDDDDPGPPPLTGNLQGYVYDYSAGGAPQPNVVVVLDGGGWQAETFTDSSGYYQFHGLGAGSAILNLKLPPGTHPLMPDWPVHTANPAGTLINLGYYWGDPPPLPVLLSANPTSVSTPANQAFSLQLNVRNQSGGPASDPVVDLRLPTAVDAYTVHISKGQFDFSEHRIWGYFGELADGETGTMTVGIQFDQPVAQSGLTAKALLHYVEQLTSQSLEIEITAGEPVSQAPAAQVATAAPPSTERAPVESSDSSPSAPEEPTEAQTETSSAEDSAPQSMATEGETETEPETQAQLPTTGKQDPSQETVAEAPITTDDADSRADVTPEPATSTDPDSSATQPESQIPTTGGLSANASAWPIMALALISLLGLGFAGVQAFIKRK